jgi:hypothetical protein
VDSLVVGIVSPVAGWVRVSPLCPAAQVARDRAAKASTLATLLKCPRPATRGRGSRKSGISLVHEHHEEDVPFRRTALARPARTYTRPPSTSQPFNAVGLGDDVHIQAREERLANPMCQFVLCDLRAACSVRGSCRLGALRKAAVSAVMVLLPRPPKSVAKPGSAPKPACVLPRDLRTRSDSFARQASNALYPTRGMS